MLINQDYNKLEKELELVNSRISQHEYFARNRNRIKKVRESTKMLQQIQNKNAEMAVKNGELTALRKKCEKNINELEAVKQQIIQTKKEITDRKNQINNTIKQNIRNLEIMKQNLTEKKKRAKEIKQILANNGPPPPPSSGGRSNGGRNNSGNNYNPQ